ncbi:MAG TPA: universal stress protein [Burkholderiales bacterium]|nr:universal stress protein [Burkholderiales bacterium]
MLKILLAVDGSENASRAAQTLIETAGWYKEPLEVELVTVHLPLPQVGGFAGSVVSHDMVEKYYSEEGGKALAPARKLLDAAGVRYVPHILVGEIAPSLVSHAQKTGCKMLYMGTRGMSAVSNLMVGSVATKVLHLCTVPVVLVH